MMNWFNNKNKKTLILILCIIMVIAMVVPSALSLLMV